MAHHPVLDPLRNDILPYTANADRLTDPFEFKVFGIYKFAQGLLGALVSAGITFPLAEAMRNVDAGGGAKPAAAFNLGDLNRASTWWAIGVFVVWMLISQILRYRTTEKKYQDAKACKNVLVDIEAELQQILKLKDPRKDIGRLHTQVFDSVRRARHSEAYPFGSGAPPDPEGRAEKKFKELCTAYQPMWRPDLDALPESDEE